MKLLKVVFIVLILITFGELSYYLYLNFYVKPSETRINNDRNIAINLDNNSITPVQKESSEPLIDNELIEYLQKRHKNTGQKFYLIEEADGIINNIKNNNSQILVQVSDDNNYWQYTLFFPLPISPINFSNFTLEKNGQKNKISDINQLRIGQRIKKYVKTDLTDDSKSVSEYTIYDK